MEKQNAAEISARRENFFAETRRAVRTYVNSDGSGKIPELDPPWREVFWILPALYSGNAADTALANRMAGRFHRAAAAYQPEIGRVSQGKVFNIFLSTAAATLLAEFGDRLTAPARRVFVWHTRQVFKTFGGAAQPDYKFHGCNDNMPMMAAKALILGGEALGNAAAVRHGMWHLHEFRRLLSRGAWASEFNSSNYSAITLSSVAKIATLSRTPEIRQLARDCETRLWAELILHYHPGSKRQGGPISRAYAPDWAGHTHMVQLLWWLMFGEESGYDVLRSFFHPAPDDPEVIAYGPRRIQSIAEYTDLLGAEFRIPEALAARFFTRDYPATTRGRSESMCQYRGGAGEYHTVNYMEEAFSLGTVDTPLAGGDGTAQLYATFKRKPVVADFRDGASVFTRYYNAAPDPARADSEFRTMAWAYAMQERNTAVLLTVPNLAVEPLTTDTLRLDVVFPAHYGTIARSVIGSGPVRDGAVGESRDPVPVSVETGEVLIHIRPLIPSLLPRRAALRFERVGNYEQLALINYEGPRFAFSRRVLESAQNGLVFTIAAKSDWPSLEAFHRTLSECWIVDYWFAGHRFFRFARADVSFELCYTPDPFGVQTRAVNGRTIPLPLFETDQLAVETLPFMSGPVAPDEPFFPWGDRLDVSQAPAQYWQIGARGLPDETPYSRRRADLKLEP